MNNLNESNAINEISDKKFGVETDNSSHKIASAPSTTCVSPVLEGKPLTNSYLEAFMLNPCHNLNQQITPNPNIGFGVNMGLGMNLNLGTLNDLNHGNSFMMPNQLYRTNNLVNNLHGVIPDYYSLLLRGYNMNSIQNSFPRSIGNNGIQLSNTSGVEGLFLNQNFVNNDEKQSENNLKVDQHSPIINPLMQSQFLSINPQPALIPNSILPRISPIITTCPGIINQIGSNSLTSSIKPILLNCQEKDIQKNTNGTLISQTKDQNSSDELEKLNNLIYSYINNINGLNDLNERARHYLNTYNVDFDHRNNISDHIKLFGSLGRLADQNNLKAENIGIDNISSISESCNNDQNEIFKPNQTRKYRLGDQGRALLKSELSAYLRCNPEKRIEASKIADIRNATTKQLWQIAAMCGLEERFINLHAQSLAQSKGKMNVRGTKKKQNSNINDLSKSIGKNPYNTKTSSREHVESELFKSTNFETSNSNSNINSTDTKCNIETKMDQNIGNLSDYLPIDSSGSMEAEPRSANTSVSQSKVHDRLCNVKSECSEQSHSPDYVHESTHLNEVIAINNDSIK